QAGTVGLYNTTVSGNLANSDASGSGNGGGVVVNAGTFNFVNTIIAGNNHIVVPGPFLEPDDCSGTVNAFGFDILKDVNALYCTVSGLPSGADPGLGPLQGNGGPTPTMALLPGSPAIDAGNPAGCTDDLGAPILTDQRGQPRPANGAGAAQCDI